MRLKTLIKAVTVSLVIVTLGLSFLALSLGNQMNQAQNRVSELQNQVVNYEKMMNAPPNVTFTNVSVGSWYSEEYNGSPLPPYTKPINATFQNLGTRSIGGLSLNCTVEGNPTKIGDDFLIYIDPQQLGILHPHESKSYFVRIVTGSASREATLSQCRLVLTLMLDKLVVDEKTVTIGD
ncbi:MAG: hypothetical protein ABSA79_05915 [Candidatus Bathyarchaeia archaeon]|jgi:hypothetical protein